MTDHLTIEGADYHYIDHTHMVVASNWYDGADSALYLFSRRDPVNVKKLLKEAVFAQRINTYMDEKPQLQALVSFAEEQVAIREPKQKLVRAIEKAKLAGLSEGEIMAVVRDCVGATN